MSKLVELRTKLKAATDELGGLIKKEERTADDESRMDALLAEVNDLGPKLEREISLDDASRRNIPGGNRQTDTTPGTAAQGGKDGTKVDLRSFGQQWVESDQFKRYQQIGGRESDKLDVKSFYHRHQIQHTEDMTPEDVRAIVNSGLLPASYVQPTIVPGFYRGEDLQGSVRDVLLNGTTNSDAITFFRETAFTNAAAGVPEATHTAGGDETPSNASRKPESALTFTEVTVPVKTVAHWIPITRQVIWDAGQMQTYVEQRLLDGLRLEESDQLLNGTGTNDLTGLLQTGSIQDLDATYFSGAPVQDDGTPNENLNRILRAKTLVRTVGRARASFAVINPADAETFLTSTDANQQYLGAGPFGGTTVPTLWGLRIVEDENIAAGTALVGDGRMAAVWDRMQSQIFIDTIDDQFIRNMLTILAEERLALTVFRPQAFAVVELAAN